MYCGGVGGMTSCSSWLFAGTSGALGVAVEANWPSWRHQPGEREGSHSLQLGPSWGHPASAFLFRDLLFWLREGQTIEVIAGT